MAQIQASKDDIKALIDEACRLNNLTRSELAQTLGISYSALHGYITRQSVQSKVFKKIQDLIETPKTSNQLSSVTLDQLINEIEARGWIIDLKRKQS
jgi:predicted transcriptional regulator